MEVVPMQVVSKDLGELEGKRKKYQVRQAMDGLQDDFNSIIIKTQSLIVAKNVPLMLFRQLITSLCVNQKQNIPFFTTQMITEVSNFSFDDIFLFLTRNEVWDFLNFHVLTKIVKHFLAGEKMIQRAIESYQPKVDVFKRNTFLQDFVQVRSSGACPIPGCKDVMVKVKGMYERYTLADVSEQEQFLASQFLLNQFIFKLKEAETGCVQITWLIPETAIELLLPENLAKRGEALKHQGILEIRVDNRYVYKVQEAENPPRNLCPNSDDEDYDTMYQQSIENSDQFWGERARKYLQWDQDFKRVNDCNNEEGIIRWFTDGKLNVSKNCLDRHACKNPDRTAIIWEMNEQKHVTITYSELLKQTCKVANVLKNQCGVQGGDVVAICMPAMPLAVSSMLACARIGAVHSVMYTALKSKEIKKRIVAAKVMITADEAPFGRNTIPLKKKIDEALIGVSSVQHVLVARRTGGGVHMEEHRDMYLEEAMDRESDECKPVSMDSEDDLFVIHTSGTTGEPIGVVHTQAGYLLYAAMLQKYVFDYTEGDVFACVSDLGWLSGHTSVVYGPLCNGATTVLFEGTATYPNEGRYWEMIERLRINQFSTTPSAIRRLMKAGDKFVKEHDLSSLKTIGSAGEPLSTDGWKWYYNVVGQQRCILVDGWGQTEIGGLAIVPQPGPSNGKLKPGCPMRPFFGVQPVLLNEKGEELKGNGVQGLLCLQNPTPGMCRRLLNTTKSLKKDYFGYFPRNPGLFFTQDYAYRDIDGDYQIQGRKDDIIRVKGVWLQVPEIESNIVQSDVRIQEATLLPLGELQDLEEAAKSHSHVEKTVLVLEVKPDIKDAERKQNCADSQRHHG
jgi:acetyl-CoA synthetase